MSSKSLLTRTNIIAFSVLMISSISLIVWLVDRSRFVHVTDARIAATMVSISSRIPGWIESFPVKDGTAIGAGDVLVTIDNRDANHQLKEIDATIRTIDAELDRQNTSLSLATRRVGTMIDAEQSNYAAASSAANEAKVLLSQAKRELTRADSLLKQKMISEATFEDRKSKVDQFEQSYKQKLAQAKTAKAELAQSQNNRAELDVIKMEMQITNSRKSELLSQRQRLMSNVEDHIIKSHLNGIVDETFANAGEYVYPGQRILMLHNPDILWIKAYVKETEIQHLHLGSDVHIQVDAYPNNAIDGKISNIGNAASSQFAMLPSPNPSGNFVKVTQRIEVQIQFDPGELDLKPGMMVELKIIKS